ncbi:MAG: hypothetical protein ABIQ15_07175 [Nocardioides sp.]
MAARGPGWRRTSRGFYVPRDTGDTAEQRIVEAGVVLPAYGGVTGWASLRWQGGAWFDGRRPDGTTLLVPLAIGNSKVRVQESFALSAERLLPRDILVVDGLRVTEPVRSVCFEARYAVGVRDAVTWLDMAAYSDLCSVAECVAYAGYLNGWTGVPRLRQALPLVEENSWSPLETRARLVWVLDAGLAPPLCNAPIFDRAGRHLLTPDLLDVEAGLVGEYDGSLHLEGRQRRRDRDRLEIYRSLGLEVVTIFSGDLVDRDRLASRILAAYRRCLREPESRRAWTTRLPAWWIRTDTVAHRRALDDDQRARLLRIRRKAG